MDHYSAISPLAAAVVGAAITKRTNQIWRENMSGSFNHSHEHEHEHEQGHTHALDSYGKAFAVGITLNIAFVIIEAAFGVIGNSLALLSDAGHNLSDVLGLVIAWIAIKLGKKGPSERRTYGYKSSSIMAALFNAIFLLVAIGVIAWEAILRLSKPSSVMGNTIVIVAIIGIAINGITALLFMSGRKGDLNIKGAFVHMAADTGVSLGVVIAGFAIQWTGWFWIDPVVSLIICIIILLGTWGLLRDSINLVMNAVPKDIDINAITDYLQSIPTVIAVHDLHVWGMSTTEVALTVHLVRSELTNNDITLQSIDEYLRSHFGIEHTTIQIEEGTYECSLAPNGSI